MKPLISPKNMLASERNYFQTSGVKSIDVMERAAAALAETIREYLDEGSTIFFACGTGGNGGDGTACARLLSDSYHCFIVQPNAPSSPDAIENLRRARACEIEILTQAPDFIPDAWVDALFGTGLSRAPEGPVADLIRRINADREESAIVFSADIPSGLNGATGSAFEPCVTADFTVTFQFLKTGMTLADGLDRCGEVIVADVGFPGDSFGPMDARLMEALDVTFHLPPRPRNVHKGMCGHLLIVAGSFGMAGAAALCASAALRSGAGLVTIACVKSIVPMLQVLAPQAMCVPLEEDGGAISEAALPELEAALRGKDAVVVGCGLSRRTAAGIVGCVLRSGLPAVVDADALNLISENQELFRLLRSHHIVTPHPGEAVRLIPGLETTDPVAAAHALAELGATVLFKGAACVICGGAETYVSASGCCGMARGGSGDVLAGIMGALLAEKSARSCALTAALASEVHGLAGELAQAKYGSRGMNSRDIIEFLPEVFPG